MDVIDNLVYATLNDCIYPDGFTSRVITSPFQDVGIVEPAGIFPAGSFPNNFTTGVASYHEQTKLAFISHTDEEIVENAIKKHWYDVVNRISYTDVMGVLDTTGGNFPMFDNLNTATPPPRAFVKFNVPPYHLIFPYLVENTRIGQIFERLIKMYKTDEKLTKATNHVRAFRWIQNTRALFMNDSFARIGDDERRNAYHRMAGVDLAFGDEDNKPVNYVKAEFANTGFMTLFETFLAEIWKGYINANNTSGENKTDTENLEDIGQRLQEMLMLRRSTTLNFTGYGDFNLSKEEYLSYVYMFWLYYIISYDSPVVQFLNCGANTPGERLINIGRKVGIQAHSKSVPLLDISQPMNLILRMIELGLFNNSNFITRVIRSQASVNPLVPPATPQEIMIMNNFLSIINNWERATGHKIKENVTVVMNGKQQLTRTPALVMN